jgi:TctA family transporter
MYFCTYVCGCLYVYMHVCMYVCMYVCVCMHGRTYSCMYYVRTYVCMFILSNFLSFIIFKRQVAPNKYTRTYSQILSLLTGWPWPAVKGMLLICRIITFCNLRQG